MLKITTFSGSIVKKRRVRFYISRHSLWYNRSDIIEYNTHRYPLA